MELLDFSSWLKATYNFDCYENQLFKIVLEDTFERFKNSTINGVAFVDYYQGHALYQELLLHYLSLLTTMIELIPESESQTSLNILGLPLNHFSRHKNNLKFQVSQLKNQCEGL